MDLTNKLNKLGVNVTAKRHSYNGTWDMRAYHPWGRECLCSVSAKPSVSDAWDEMEIRLPAILERNETILKAINEKREKHFNKEDKPTNFWEDWI